LVPTALLSSRGGGAKTIRGKKERQTSETEANAALKRGVLGCGWGGGGGKIKAPPGEKVLGTSTNWNPNGQKAMGGGEEATGSQGEIPFKWWGRKKRKTRSCLLGTVYRGGEKKKDGQKKEKIVYHQNRFKVGEGVGTLGKDGSNQKEKRLGKKKGRTCKKKKKVYLTWPKKKKRGGEEEKSW